MAICVIFTGGTIGSTVEEGYISTDKEKKYRLLELYRQSVSDPGEFYMVEAYTLLSENLNGEYLKKLIECVEKQLAKDFEGIIITHGTDTLQYSAAALSYAFPGAQLPVVLVSSNYVLDDSRANGSANFKAAVEFIRSGCGTGVFVAYRNSDGLCYLHRGSRLLGHLPYSDDVFSLLGQFYGIMGIDGTFRKNEAYMATSCNPTHLPAPSAMSSEILRIYPYPGMTYPELTADIKAILLDTYHSGTLCGTTPNMKTFFTHASEKGIPVFLIGANNECDYESVKEWQNLGIQILPMASPIAMYIKLWMLLNSKTDDLFGLMCTSIGEDLLVSS